MACIQGFVPFSFLSGTIIREIESNYIDVDYKQGKIARQVQDMFGSPSARDFINIVQMNLLSNCPITTSNIMAADDKYHLNLGSLKGKTVHRQGKHVTTEYIDLPMTIMPRYRDLVLCIDVIFVNNIPFLMTISQCIRFGTAEKRTLMMTPTTSTWEQS